MPLRVVPVPRLRVALADATWGRTELSPKPCPRCRFLRKPNVAVGGGSSHSWATREICAARTGCMWGWGPAALLTAPQCGSAPSGVCVGHPTTATLTSGTALRWPASQGLSPPPVGPAAPRGSACRWPGPQCSCSARGCPEAVAPPDCRPLLLRRSVAGPSGSALITLQASNRVRPCTAVPASCKISSPGLTVSLCSDAAPG